MRYASIRNMDISNGQGVGVSLFVQGCPFHCYNCFNPETWDFEKGEEWTQKIESKFLKLVNRPYIKRISLLGGEPLAKENLDDILNLVNKIRLSFPEKTIWLYSGYTWESIFGDYCAVLSRENHHSLYENINERDTNNAKRREIIRHCNVMIDGRYIDSQRDITLKWRGSSNQRVIDIQKSLQQNRVVLYCD